MDREIALAVSYLGIGYLVVAALIGGVIGYLDDNDDPTDADSRGFIMLGWPLIATILTMVLLGNAPVFLGRQMKRWLAGKRR